MNRPAVILVVDDDPAFLGEVTGYLASRGLKVLSAQNAQEALTIMMTEKPNLTLMDIMLPKLSGLRASEIALALNYRQSIVLMTGAKHVYDQAPPAGTLDILPKPLSPAKLARIVHAYLGRQEQGSKNGK